MKWRDINWEYWSAWAFALAVTALVHMLPDRGRTMATETPSTDCLLARLATGVSPDQIPHSWVEPLVEHARKLERALLEREALIDRLLLQRGNHHG